MRASNGTGLAAWPSKAMPSSRTYGEGTLNSGQLAPGLTIATAFDELARMV